MSVDLKPCPFCGGEALFATYQNISCTAVPFKSRAWCRDCLAQTRDLYGMTQDDVESRVADEWNIRGKKRKPQ
jgi:hypothetical protein